MRFIIFFRNTKKKVFTDAKYYIILGAPANFVPPYYFLWIWEMILPPRPDNNKYSSCDRLQLTYNTTSVIVKVIN